MLARDCGRGEKAGGPVRSVTLTLVTPRHLPSEVWDVIAQPERLARWYGPVSGELRVGGRFRVEGEAAGTILACEPGRRLEFAWEAAGESGWVDIALSHYGGGGARLILTHSVRETDRWRTFGPAGIGVGWDLASHALVGHLSRPGVDIDLRTVAALPESRRLLASSAESWGRLAIEAGDKKAIGQLIDLNQMLLSGLFLSTPEIEQMCAAARAAGAYGAKLTGAGGGGSVIALVEGPAEGAAVLAAWKNEGFDGFLTTFAGDAARARIVAKIELETVP